MNLYDDRIYLWKYEKGEDGRQVPRVHVQARWIRRGQRYPVWLDDPSSVFQRGYFPLRLLRPGETAHGEITRWCDTATDSDLKRSRDIEIRINQLRERIITFNLPFLELPPKTPRHIALDVFIKVNTSLAKLTAFDIIVARFEEKKGESLHQLVKDLATQVPEIESYQTPKDLVLSSAAMREDRPPTQTSFHRLDLGRLADTWSDLTAGIQWTINVLKEERIFDAARLPTVAVLPVLTALHSHLPKALDARGRANALVRSYIWRAFFTHRYDNSAATNALQDLRGLVKSIRSPDMRESAPIFDEEEYPLPTHDELAKAGWPRRKDTLARAILALSLKSGARDFADDEKVSRQHLAHREYHHLFPHSLLTGEGTLASEDSYRALNCALVTWNTNRRIGATEPIKYLRDRAAGANLGDSEVKIRLASHLIPYKWLAVGGYDRIRNKRHRAKRIREDYSKFLLHRAKLMRKAIKALCNGEVWPASED
ncbi:MAG: hypothetical protein OXF68_06540 [Gammaproteobacteria bacterium]|nr:hypothetical protein [Gammaproteobacteria bacterium]